jgi:hypothetical protein
MKKSLVSTRRKGVSAPCEPTSTFAVSSRAAEVRQEELQAVVDVLNTAQLLAANIRRRIEGGATIQRGKLGVCTINQEPLSDFLNHDRDYVPCSGVSDLCGIEIAPVEELRSFADFIDSSKYKVTKPQFLFM